MSLRKCWIESHCNVKYDGKQPQKEKWEIVRVCVCVMWLCRTFSRSQTFNKLNNMRTYTFPKRLALIELMCLHSSFTLAGKMPDGAVFDFEETLWISVVWRKHWLLNLIDTAVAIWKVVHQQKIFTLNIVPIISRGWAANILWSLFSRRITLTHKVAPKSPTATLGVFLVYALKMSLQRCAKKRSKRKRRYWCIKCNFVALACRRNGRRLDFDEDAPNRRRYAL